MRIIGIGILLFLAACSSLKNSTSQEKTLSVSFFDRVVSDIERIQPATSAKFSNLEMNYTSVVSDYRKEFVSASSVAEQVQALEKAYYAYHDGHFIQFAIEGIDPPVLEDLSLPFSLMPVGDHLSDAHFFVYNVQMAAKWVGSKPENGDELISVDEEKVPALILKHRDRVKDSNPVGVPSGKNLKLTVRFVPTVSVDMSCKLTMGVGEPVDQKIDFQTLFYDPGKTYGLAIFALNHFHVKNPKLCGRSQADAIFKELNAL